MRRVGRWPGNLQHWNGPGLYYSAASREGRTLARADCPKFGNGPKSSTLLQQQKFLTIQTGELYSIYSCMYVVHVLDPLRRATLGQDLGISNKLFQRAFIRASTFHMFFWKRSGYREFYKHYSIAILQIVLFL